MGMKSPCELCGDPFGPIKAGDSSPTRVHGVCLRCANRIRSRARHRGLTWDEARALDGGVPTAYPAPLPGCRPYVHPEQPAPVPVRWATNGFREFWEER